jgi:DNA modification methylase
MEMTYQLHLGDCLDVLATLPDNSVDSIVTDPPYGLSFMGKKWDYDVPSVAIWEQCLRVLKPGGHLLAFAGTRTQHRMACRIEDAGFEIRDMIAWVYGSGFPKSLDVSKAIDKCNGEAGRLLKFTAWMRTTGLSAKQINDATGTFMGSHYLTDKSQPAIPTPDLWAMLRPLCGDVPYWVDELVQRIEAEREVVGQQEMTDTTKARAGFSGPTHSPDYEGSKRMVNITAPATPEARQWSGWGTALKPALEPITMARKPFSSTVAANVIQYGTGAINVDGCRVGDEVTTSILHGKSSDAFGIGQKRPPFGTKENPCGRWPANIIHDGSNEAALSLKSGARFFYTAKAGKDDRETDNNHPTVKPTMLMAYLCRLVTPPGGTVLDPFMGSGSTGKAATVNGFRFIGIERDPEYYKISEARISNQHEGRLL